MWMRDYQEATDEFATYPGDKAVEYLTLGLASEAGEVADKVKKTIRDKDGVFDHETVQGLSKELGDVLWYVAQLALYFELSMDTIAQENLKKLKSRAERNVLGGSGDDR